MDTRLHLPTIALRAALAIAGMLLFFRYLLPWTAPVLLALLLASMCEKRVAALCGAGWSRSCASALMTVTVLAAAGAAALFLVSRAVAALYDVAAALPAFLEKLADMLYGAREGALSLVDSAPEELRGYLGAALASVTSWLYGLPAALADRLPGAIGRLAAATPDVLLFAATSGIGLFFISASWPELARFAGRRAPPRLRSRLLEARESLRGAFGRYLLVQARLMALTFAELLAAFVLLRAERPLALAAIVSVVDALPVLGTGTVLIPWAIWCFVTDRAARGLGLAATYSVITLVRSCVQPKLVGDELGLHPAVSLLAIYAGWRAFGVWGMLLFPILAVVVKRLGDTGLIRLWQSY